MKNDSGSLNQHEHAETKGGLAPLDRRPASMKGFNVVHVLQKRKLLIAINCIAGLSICKPWLVEWCQANVSLFRLRPGLVTNRCRREAARNRIAGRKAGSKQPLTTKV